MKLVVQIKLLPSPEQAEALAATLAACNAAANWVSRVGWEEQCFANRILRGKAYRQLKEQYGLSAQPAQHVIKKVADAYKVNRTKRRSFRGDAAQPFDDRCLSWQVAAGTVSIWTIHGRIKGIRFTCARDSRTCLLHAGVKAIY